MTELDARGKLLLENARAATENGYDLCCSYCGEGLASEDWDDDDNHDYWCPTRTSEFKAERARDEAAFAERIGGILEKGKVKE